MSDEREYLDLAKVLRPDGRVLDVYGCPDCGALVFWQGKHDDFHRETPAPAPLVADPKLLSDRPGGWG